MNHLPNILSIIRLLIAPIFFILFISNSREFIIISYCLYIIAALSDYLDGFFARKFSAYSKFGNFLDPLADKILTSVAFISFSIKDIIPLWMVLIVIFRDILTTLLRIYKLDSSSGLLTSKLAKWKTFLQMLFIFFILSWITFFYISKSQNSSIYQNLLKSEVLDYIMFILTILSIYSLLDYVKSIIKKTKSNSKN